MTPCHLLRGLIWVRRRSHCLRRIGRYGLSLALYGTLFVALPWLSACAGTSGASTTRLQPDLQSDLDPESIAADSPQSSSTRANLQQQSNPKAAPSEIMSPPTFITPGSPPAYQLRRVGILNDPRASEISGLAVSGLTDKRLWMVNDSGNSAALMAFSTRGRFLASVATALINRDWEALVSFTLNEQAYLLVADTGDNLRTHDHYTLLIFQEPDIDKTLPKVITPVSTIDYVYPDGKHNSEAIAVSVTDREIVIITKSPNSPGIYSLPLTLDQSHTKATATRRGTLAPLGQSYADQVIGQLIGVDLSQATGFEINHQGNTAFVLTYRGIYRWTRESDTQHWGTVLSRPAEVITRHSLAQGEALALSRYDRQLYLVSEGSPSPVLVLSPQPVHN